MAVVAVALAQQRMEVLAVSEAAVVLLIFIILAAEEALAVVGVAVPILGKAEAGAVVAAEVEVVAVQPKPGIGDQLEGEAVVEVDQRGYQQHLML